MSLKSVIKLSPRNTMKKLNKQPTSEFWWGIFSQSGWELFSTSCHIQTIWLDNLFFHYIFLASLIYIMSFLQSPTDSIWWLFRKMSVFIAAFFVGCRMWELCNSTSVLRFLITSSYPLQHPHIAYVHDFHPVVPDYSYNNYKEAVSRAVTHLPSPQGWSCLPLIWLSSMWLKCRILPL